MLHNCKKCNFVWPEKEGDNCPACGSDDYFVYENYRLEQTLIAESGEEFERRVNEARAFLNASAGKTAAKEGKTKKKRKKKGGGESVKPAAEPVAAAVKEIILSPAEYEDGPVKDRPEACAAAFSPRELPPLENREILISRLHYEQRQSKYADTQEYYEGDKLVGLVPKIRISEIWKKAQEYYNGAAEKNTGISEELWNATQSKFISMIAAKGGAAEPYLLQNILELSELDFKELYLEKAGGVVKLLKACILADIKESEAVVARWKKIKNYIFKVAVCADDGNFSESDAKKLNGINVRYLNDIKKLSVYDLKNIFLDHSYKTLIDDINAAFKEDLEKRKDGWYQIFPFVFAFAALLANAVTVYFYRYTILKSVEGTAVIFFCLALWIVTIAFLVRGGIRAVKRRRKRRGYYYFTGKVKTAFTVFVLFSVFVVGSDSLFYERYDNYNDEVYYRYSADDEIIIAGLFNKELTSLEIPSVLESKPVVRVAGFSFSGNKNLKSVTVPQSVSTIGNGAFRRMKALERVTLPELEELPDNLFSGCETLVNVKLGDGVERIGNNAFYKCKNLKELQIPSTVRTVGKSAFSASGLESADVTGATDIGDRAFSNCTALQSVYIPDAEKLGARCFGGCSALTDISFGTVRTIGDRAFEDCVSITGVDLSEADMSGFAAGLFKNCTGITQVIMPQTVYSIPNEMFSGCSSLESVDLSNAKAIGDRAFEGCALKEAVIKDQTESIGKESFKNIFMLAKVSVAPSVKSIGEHAFDTSGLIREVSVPYLGASADDLKDGYSHLFGKTDVNKLTVTESEEIGNSLGGGKEHLFGISYVKDVEIIPKNAFSGFENLTYAHIPGVKNIGDNAFKGCVNLAEAGFGSALTIGKSAFSGSGIEYADISGATGLGDRAFENCLKLKGISIANAEKVGARCFSGCRALVDITFGTVRTIGDRAFEDCVSVSSVDLSEADMSGFAAGLFKDCTGITQVKLPYKSYSVPKEMFSGCWSLKSVDLSNAIAIGDRAFEGCALGEVVISDKTEKIGKECFKDIFALKSVTVPYSVKEIGKHAFATSGTINNVTVPYLGKNANHLQSGFAHLFGNTNVTNLNVTRSNKIGGSLGGAKNHLYGISYSEEVEKIPNNAFKNFRYLEYASIPGVKTIGSGAFNGCYMLSSALFYDVLSIGNDAFKGCGNLSRVSFGKCESIGSHAFEKCSDLDYISLPDTLVKLGNCAFYKSGLSSLDIGDSLEVIPEKAFYECENLGNIYFGKGVNTVGKKAFYGCGQLTQLNIGDSVETIKSAAFKRCRKLSGINFGSGLKKVDKYAFQDCTSLVDVSLNQGLEQIEKQAFNSCWKLKSATLPKNLKKIGWHVFSGCDALQSLTVPFIGSTVDKNKGISYLTNSKNLEYVETTAARGIKKKAFSGKTSLTEVRFNKEVAELGDKCFNRCRNLKKVHVSRSCSGLENIPDGAYVEWDTY